jgi:hypothetical protein
VKEEAYYEYNRTNDDKSKQGVNVKYGIKRKGGESPEHNEFAMSDVQNPGNAILQTQAHGNQGIDTAHQQTANGYIQDAYNAIRHNDNFLVLAIMDTGYLKEQEEPWEKNLLSQALIFAPFRQPAY